jgi:transcriptional regulator with XRE-family HTH domain
MDIGKRFGANLNHARRAAGYTQESLAARAGLHRTEIGLLEQGRRVPRIDTVARLAGAIGVAAGELLIGIELKPRPITIHQIQWQVPRPKRRKEGRGRRDPEQ